MTNLYYYSSHSFPTTIKMVRYFDQLKLIPKGFTIGEERELAPCLKQVHFTKGDQSIHLQYHDTEFFPKQVPPLEAFKIYKIEE